MTSNTTDLADLPSRLGPLPTITPATPAPTTRSRWENREPTEATYAPAVAARVEQLRREEQLKTPSVSSASPSSPPVTIVPPDSAEKSCALSHPAASDPPEGKVVEKESARRDLFIRVAEDSPLPDAGRSVQDASAMPNLLRCEREIETHLVAAFFATGKALREIRDKVLYDQGSYDTFEEYLRCRWHLDRTYAHRLIQTAQGYENLLPIGNAEENLVPLPTSEVQVRPLVRLDPDSQRKAWRGAINGTESLGVPTASQVERAAAVVRPPKSKKRTEHAHSLVVIDSPAPETKPETTEELPPAGDDAATNLAIITQTEPTPVNVDLEHDGGLQLKDADGNPPRTLSACDVTCASGARDVAALVGGTRNSAHAIQTRGAKGSDIDQHSLSGQGLISDEKVQQAMSAVCTRDYTSPDRPDLIRHVRRMVPLIAATLNRYAQEFSEMDGYDLCQALGMANTKLQISMKWM